MSNMLLQQIFISYCPNLKTTSCLIGKLVFLQAGSWIKMPLIRQKYPEAAKLLEDNNGSIVVLADKAKY